MNDPHKKTRSKLNKEKPGTTSIRTANQQSELQEETNVLLRRAIFYSFFWLAGFGSLYSVILARKAKRIIDESGGMLKGAGKVRWCFILGSVGMLIWFPIFVLMIVNSLSR